MQRPVGALCYNNLAQHQYGLTLTNSHNLQTKQELHGRTNRLLAFDATQTSMKKDAFDNYSLPQKRLYRVFT
jgi:hypothetical protein